MNNYYWMEGPLPGDTGCRVTVLHAGKTQQCSNCLKLAPLGCPGKGNGKACTALGTPRTTMYNYMEFIKIKNGYRSLKSKYFEQFPNPGGAANFCISDMQETPVNSGDDEDIVPQNPIEEKDRQIAELKKALEESRSEVNDVTDIKDCLVKTRDELKLARHSSIMKSKKIDFARKVTEQRMSNSLSNLSDDLEEELVSLYSTLVDEENFLVENNEILPEENFLKDVEEKLSLRGSIPSERERLDQIKNKILEKVKQRKDVRRERRESISSVGSMDSKRGNGDSAGGDSSRVKVDVCSSLPIPIKF